MKKFAPFIFILLILVSGCGSSKKQLQKGNYDAAVQKSVKQLRKDPSDVKQKNILDQAYKVANDQDNERVRLLKMEGKPNNWDEIYLVYKTLNDRQALVRTIPSVNYQQVDYVPDMVNAKRKAADYYFGHGNDLMKSGIKESCRQAYAEFIRAKDYVGDYEGIDNKILDAKTQGMSRVFVSVQNSSVLKFPKEFEDDLLTLDFPRLNSEWVEYYTHNLNGNTQYDYFVNVNIKNVAVSPDQSLQTDSVIKRDIDDGYSYVFDKKGNVMKDTLGNDIKLKKYKTVQCALVQTALSKTCRIDGDVEVISMNPNKTLSREPFGAQSSFENISSRALGDTQALNAKQLERTKTPIVPFPTDIDMIVRCSESLKKAISTSIQSNRRFIF